MSNKFKMDFSKLLEQIDSADTKKNYNQNADQYWKPTKDKAGNADVLMHFLPNKNFDDIPYVRKYKHNFQDKSTGRWYIENSLTTIGGQDYISTVNTELWQTGIEENKKLASYRKRKLSYISNVLIINDVNKPENNGKVFKYEYGAKIFEKIKNASKANPALGEEPIIAFDPIGGADFLLKMRKVDDQFNYDESKFATPKPLFGGDEDKIEELLSRCYDINEEISPDKFKSEEELKARFLYVIGEGNGKVSNSTKDADAEHEQLQKIANQKPKEKPKADLPTMGLDPDDDDDADFFAKLANS